MDRGFNLSINTGPYPVDFTKVHAYKDANQKRVDDLAQLMIDEDTFDASLILEALFPAVKADIFCLIPPLTQTRQSKSHWSSKRSAA